MIDTYDVGTAHGHAGHSCSESCGSDTELFEYDGPEQRTTEQLVHLHLHTEHSFLDGIPTMKQLVDRIAELNQDTVAVTDHGECSGHLRFQKAAHAKGIKPVFGMEGYFCDDRTLKAGKKGELYDHITVLAKNDEGLHNLWALGSEAFISGQWYGDPRFDWDLLSKYSEGLIATGGCLSGAVAKYLNPQNAQYNPDRAVERLARFIEAFKGEFFLELHTFNDEKQRVVNEALVDLGSEMGVGLIVVSDSHYLRPEDWEDHELLTAIQMGKTYDDPNRYSYGPNQLCVFSEKEVRERVAYLGDSVVSEAVANTRDIATRCNAEIKGTRSIPTFFATPEEDIEKMKEMAWEGMKTRVYPYISESERPAYDARLEYEMGIVIPKGFAQYFNTVGHIARNARKKMLVSVRGSAAGSLLSYSLKITGVNPIKAKLLFERFMDPERDSAPDIDLDFPQLERHIVRADLEEEYGRDHVASIGSLDTLKPKRLMRDLCRGLRIPNKVMNDMLKVLQEMPDLEVAHIETKWVDIWGELGHKLAPFARTGDPWQDAQITRLFGLMEKFGEHIRHSGVHAAGVVLSKESLIGKIPLREKNGDIRTQFDFKDTEDLGFVKIDVLGLRTLSTLMAAYDLAKERHPDDHDWKPDVDSFFDGWQFEWDKFYEDTAVFEGLWAGKNIGVFQLESTGFRQLVKKFKPANIEDLCAMVSVYRPGITRTYDEETGLNLLDLYLEKRDGKREAVYKHEKLRHILDVTSGNFLYQEQIMQTCVDLAGYSLSETDRVRRILGKKKVEDMVKERQIFVDGFVRTGNGDEHLGHQIFDDMEAFGKYGFNRAHGYVYAMVAYWTAWMKHYYPREFMTALFMTNEEEAPVYGKECSRMGIQLLGPDINESGATFSLTAGGIIRYGLSKIKYLGASAEVIAELRPFSSVDDLVERVPKTKLNKQKVHSAIAVGAMDSLITDEMVAESNYPKWWNKTQIALYRYYEARADWKSIDDECTDCGGHSNFEHLCKDLKLSNRAEVEKEYLGSVVSVNPLGPYMDTIASWETFTTEDDMLVGETRWLGGLVSRVNPTVTKQGKSPGSPMCQMWVDRPTQVRVEGDEETDDQVQIVVWPENYKDCGADIEVGAPVIVKVKKLNNGGVCLHQFLRLDRATS